MTAATIDQQHPPLRWHYRRAQGRLCHFRYDRESHVGKLDKGLDEAAAKGWTIVDMKNDWKTVFKP